MAGNRTHDLPSNLIDGGDGFLQEMAQWAFDVTGGFYWTGMLIAFCIVLMISTLRFGSTRSFAYASFAGMNGAIFLGILGLMPWWIVSAFIIVGAIGLASIIISKL